MPFASKTILATSAAFMTVITLSGSAIASPVKSFRPTINRVDCKGRVDYLQIWTRDPNHQELCFANAGSIDTRIYNVWKLYAGNNEGYVRAQFPWDKQITGYDLSRWGSFSSLDEVGIVYSVTIR